MPTREEIIAEGIKALANWIIGFHYQSIGSNCPGCGHNPVYERHVGAPLFGHNQRSCPCRLVRQANPSFPCGCEWTQDL
jgi:hypothetical protein